jgi:hypothetical protein
MSVVSLVALAVGNLLNADPKRIARIVGGMRIAILPMFALIFLLDWVTSAGVVAPALYAVPVLATSLCVSLEWSFASALFASALTYIGYFISQPGGNVEDAYINRLIAAILIWACVLFGWLLGHVRKEIQAFHEQHK